MRKNQMNERIFKLALKAMDFQGAVDIDTELKLTNSELEKFAELIVRECAELATKEYNNRGAIHGNDLLEHFGVKE
jgi:hypothetical protein